MSAEDAARNLNVTCAGIWFFLFSGATVQDLSILGFSLHEANKGFVAVFALGGFLWFWYKYSLVAMSAKDVLAHWGIAIQTVQKEWPIAKIIKRLFSLSPASNWSYHSLDRTTFGKYELLLNVSDGGNTIVQGKAARWLDVWPILIRSTGSFARSRNEFSVHFLPRVVARITLTAIAVRLFW